MIKGYKGLTNEELVKLSVEGNTEAFDELMKNTEGLRVSLAKKYTIPGMDMDDLLQEGAMEMYQAMSRFNEAKAKFTSFIYTSITQRYNTLYKAATAEKRNSEGDYSFDQMNSNSEFDGEENSLGNTLFCVECEEYSRVELLSLLESINFSEKEGVVARYLAKGFSRSDVREATGMSQAMVGVLSKRIGKKMILAGAFV